ncbi:MAG: nucleotide sugar dehydrogenase [Deltaproteobacteria bacterium]|nr:nucleotide sugar dehydrogenase [Deltaproteobacteria bacterium]
MLDIGDFETRARRVAVVGLGYVGLPLAALLASRYAVVGFDINPERIRELQAHRDRTREVDAETLKQAGISFTHEAEKLSMCDLVIVTVPTPIDRYRRPDLGPIRRATEIIGARLQPGAVVVYESTVYPGVTEEVCVPILEATSGLVWKKDFHVGYSPERINPGDRKHTIDKIMKVVSGDTGDTAELLAALYGSVIPAGVHVAPDIKTAEAAKVIENTQRDLNIALMNELSLIFGRLGIGTRDVLEAAGTKWNFLKFEPGLVGGHCIGVAFKAESLGYHPQIILAGRRINDHMGKYVAENTLKLLIKRGRAVKGSRVLILGLTFKENISDIRNTKVIDIYNELADYGIDVVVHDPFAYNQEVKEKFGIDLIEDIEQNKPYDGMVLAVKHLPYVEALTLERLKRLSNGEHPVLVDVKGFYSPKEAQEQGFAYWRL